MIQLSYFFILFIFLGVSNEKDIIIQINPIDNLKCIESKGMVISEDIENLQKAFAEGDYLNLIVLGRKFFEEGKEIVFECFKNEISQITDFNPKIMDCLLSKVDLSNITMYLKLYEAYQIEDKYQRLVKIIPLLSEYIKDFTTCFEPEEEK